MIKLQDYTSTRLTDYLINLTTEPVSVYEESSGAIKTYPPQHLPLPPFRLKRTNEGIFHYIVSGKMLRRAKRERRPLDDLAVVSDSCHGRGGIAISRLTWGLDSDIKVLVVPSASSTVVRHL